MVFGFFHRKRTVLGDTTSYSIMWQILLYKWIFSWLMLSDSTRKERCKNNTFFRQLVQDNGESLTKMATCLNYYRMLCAYSMEPWITLSALSITVNHLWLLPFCIEKFSRQAMLLSTLYQSRRDTKCVKMSQWSCNVY